MNEIKFTITPSELLTKAGLQWTQNRNWIGTKYCPFCGGGQSKQVKTFAVHMTQGNYVCLRENCGEDRKGSFWRLIERLNFNPRDYIDRENSTSNKKGKGKRFVYGKTR